MLIKLRENTTGLLLLIAILLFLIVPIPITFFPGYYKLIFAIVYSILIIVGISTLTEKKGHRFIGFALGLISFALIWINTFGQEIHEIQAAQASALLVFFSFMAFHLFRQIALNNEITLNIIYSSISGYLMIGLIGGSLFQLLEIAIPGSFKLLSQNGDLYDLHYFSFVTLTTLGFGDISPLNEAAKSLTIILSLAGQLYLTILIAILVGKYLSK